MNSYEAFFFEEVTENCTPAVSEAISQIYDWSKTMHGYRWGRGKKNPLALHILGKDRRVAYITADGWVWLAVRELKKVPPFGTKDHLQDLLHKLRAVPGLELTDKPDYRRFDLRKVVQLGKTSSFLDVLAWAMEKMDQA